MCIRYYMSPCALSAQGSGNAVRVHRQDENNWLWHLNIYLNESERRIKPKNLSGGAEIKEVVLNLFLTGKIFRAGAKGTEKVARRENCATQALSAIFASQARPEGETK